MDHLPHQLSLPQPRNFLLVAPNQHTAEHDDSLTGCNYKKGKFSATEDQQITAAVEKFRVVRSITLLVHAMCQPLRLVEHRSHSR